MVDQITGDSAEIVALDLFEKIAAAEGMVFHGDTSGGQTTATREWILSTYTNCLWAAKSPKKPES